MTNENNNSSISTSQVTALLKIFKKINKKTITIMIQVKLFFKIITNKDIHNLLLLKIHNLYWMGVWKEEVDMEALELWIEIKDTYLDIRVIRVIRTIKWDIILTKVMGHLKEAIMEVDLIKEELAHPNQRRKVKTTSNL